MAEPTKLLRVSELVKRYETGAGPVPVLDGVSLQLAKGDALAVVGPSGSGKSTLLQIIGTLDQATSGRVELGGRDLGTLDNDQLAQVRNLEIGFVFQSHYLLPQCTTWENVLVPTLAATRETAAGAAPSQPASFSSMESVPQRAERLLKRVGLAERMAHFPGQLSGGERQRVAVVRALINRPALLLADEPTGALDHASAESLSQLLVELNREEGVSMIVVTHSMDLARRMKRVVRLEGGSLQEDGA
ncbi:MAG: ABC transporter ATP-binding protein [Verrucomicrobia bacterium]|jgi:predicted ABC-type transport system involved in lysophospholipase L1 biosynthesis ATPase subunit|nr:ABC transporter ATP-binding protein [Verrucomicrobiota bacterium]